MTALFFLMILSGMTCLLLSLPSSQAILNMLGEGDLRTKWRFMRWGAIAFIGTYALIATMHIGRPIISEDLVTGAILLAAGGFGLLFARLSEMTTGDLLRISSLERDVMRDPLTGLFNRRYLDIRLDEEISRARRSGLPVSALMLDLDHFKRINDRYGHPVGDQVLRHVGALILSQVRVNDVVVRCGGEEFMVIAPDSALDQASHLGARLIYQLEHQKISLADGEELTVTASIGVATLDKDETQTSLMARADKALYQAKNEGRNRISIAPPNDAESILLA